ncbi:MAG: hypothetical protein KAW39_06260 [Thermoplasmata archaeon]|nr:hypothetical protein [Thermoplasmata archaeon]
MDTVRDSIAPDRVSVVDWLENKPYPYIAAHVLPVVAFLYALIVVLASWLWIGCGRLVPHICGSSIGGVLLSVAALVSVWNAPWPREQWPLRPLALSLMALSSLLLVILIAVYRPLFCG